MTGSEKEWFIGRDNKQYGPYSDRVLRIAAAQGRLRAHDLVWAQGMEEWVCAESISDFALLMRVLAPASTEPASKPIPEPSPSASAEAPVSTVTAPITKLRTNYFSRHWHGDFSLAQSFWVNNFAVNFVLTIVATALSEIGLTHELGIRSTGLWILGLFTVAAVVSIWSAVGVWNSAQAHTGRGGNSVWAVVAMLLVVLGLFRLVQTGITEAPLVSESFDLALGRESLPPAELRVLNRATEVEIAGGLSFGTTDRLKTILDATPTVHLVQLNNSGGWIQEGSRLGELVAERKLATYTARECDSACLLVFMSGEERFLGSHGRLGFHQASVAGVGGEVAQEGTDIIRASLERRRAPQAFIDHVLATPPSTVWYPTTEELLSAHIITAVVDERTFGETGIAGWRNRAKLEQDFDAVPVIAALAAAEPALYAKLKARYLSNVEAGVPESETFGEFHTALINEIVPKYLAHGENQSLMGYWATQLAEMRELQAIDPKDCIAFLYPTGNDAMRVSGLISKKAMHADYDALAALLSATAQNPAPVPAKKAVEATLMKIVRHTEQVLPGSVAVLAKMSATGPHPDALCADVLEFYGSILALRPSEAGPLLRFLTVPDAPPVAAAPARPKAASTNIKMDPEHPLKIGEEYYPDASKRASEEGRCIAAVTVSTDGTIINESIQTSSGFPRLDEACLRGVHEQRMIPATEDGKPVAKRVALPIIWKLTNQ